MVIYDLVCDLDHCFEGWFKNADEWQQQTKAGLLTCPICGSAKIAKKPTAANVTRKSNSASLVAQQKGAHQVVSSDSNAPEKFEKLQRMLGRIHEFVDQNFEDVGNQFAKKAIGMQKGEVKQANIRGVASKEQVKELAAEGIEAVALPPKPIDTKKLN